MKKGILCILLSLLLVLPLFTACTQEVDLTGTEVSIYTLYTIVDEATTPEAIRQVELSLNRILFYRLGVILDLQMVTADKYEEFLDAKLEEIEQYQLEKKNNKNNKNSSAASSEGENVTSEEVMTGDKVLEMLENGEDIVLKNPRLDIFLVQGYDKYYELATDGKLAQLDEKLNNEGKALTSSIHSTLFNAAKVGGKTYGIPVNNAIGEYTYLVFDEELLDKYSIDPNTIKSLEDLQDYLETIKQNEPDVVPLMNAVEPTELNFLLNAGFPAVVNNKVVSEAYTNKNVLEYFSTVARYEALGYINNDANQEDTRYAVRIESGSTDDIEKRLADTGYDYEYGLYSAPVATNETTIDNIFCISQYVVSNELTDVIDIITNINTDAQLMNLLTYGVENEHYVINDYGQVERLETPNPYIVNPNHIGNCFITYTLDGENPEKWNEQIKQNQEATASPSLGFTMTPYVFTYTEESQAEDGTVVKEEIEISEPDYISIINSVVDKYYPALTVGNAVSFDYNALVTEATTETTTEFTARLDKLYADNVLMPMLNAQVREEIVATRSDAIRQKADSDVRTEFANKVKNNLKKSLKKELTEANPDATEEEIDALVQAQLTDEYIAENMSNYYSEEEINEKIEVIFNASLEGEIAAAAKAIIGTAEYDRAFNNLKNSEDYANDLQKMMTYDAPHEIQEKVNAKITALISEYTENMKTEMNTAIETAVETFITENSEKLGLSREEMLIEMGYLGEKEATEEGGEGTDGETSDDTSAETSDVVSEDVTSEEVSDVSTEEASSEEPTEESADDAETSEGEGEETEPKAEIVELYESWFLFVLEGKIGTTYSTLFPVETAA